MVGLRQLPLLLIAMMAVASGWSCQEERKSFAQNADAETTPTMTTTDVLSVISDSGYTRYRIKTPIWQIFDEAKVPFWRFPDGLDLLQYDENFNPAASVRCDSATYFSNKRLWRLDGHVVMVNTERDSFLTTQLFWDQLHSKVYSDSFIHIVRTDRVIEGYGFESNQNMTVYKVKRPTGIIPIDRNRRKTAAQSDTVADTVVANPMPKNERRRQASAAPQTSGAPMFKSNNSPEALQLKSAQPN